MEGENNKCVPQDDASEPEENIAEYSALRDSIIQCENSIKNETLYMYVIYFALIVLGFEHSWMFLVSFVVLIIFQTHINEDRIAIEKVSAFIMIFFEQKREDIHWETFNKDLHGMQFYNNHIRNLGWYINKAGSTFLAAISLIALIITILQTDQDQITAFSAIQLMVGFILFLVVGYINSKLYTNSKTFIIASIDNGLKDFKKREKEKYVSKKKGESYADQD